MSTTLTLAQPKALLTAEDFEVLKNSKFKGFTEAEVSYCGKVINQLHLSPFVNQIHFVRRFDKQGKASITTQVGIDGFRLIAQRSGECAGIDEPIFTYDPKDTKEKDPIKATVTVYRIVKGVRCAYSASARWDEYCPADSKLSFMWDRMSHVMLGKCAEALALRKAFPAELSGVYAEEELHQAERPGVYPSQPEEGDGNMDGPKEYVVPSGTYAKRYLREIDPKELAGYIERREVLLKQKPDKKPLWWDEFVEKAEEYLASLENSKVVEVQTGDFNDF